MTALDRALARVRAVVAGVSGAAGLVASIATLLCLALVCGGVAARYLFGTPLGWVDRVATWLVVALVLLGAPEAQRRFEHIGVDVAVGRLGAGWARAAHVLGATSVAVVAGVLLVAGVEAVTFSRMIGLMTDVDGVPEWWVQLALPIGAAVLLMVALVQALIFSRGGEPPFLPTPDDARLDRSAE